MLLYINHNWKIVVCNLKKIWDVNNERLPNVQICQPYLNWREKKQQQNHHTKNDAFITIPRI